MENLVERLTTLGVVLGFWAIAYLVRLFAGFKNVRKQMKDWNWSQFRDGLFDRFCWLIATAGAVIGCEMLKWLMPSIGITFSPEVTLLLDTASVIAIPFVNGVADLVLGIKSIQASSGWENNVKSLEASLEGMNVDYNTIAHDTYETINNILTTVFQAPESVEEQQKFEEEGGRGAYFSVPITNYQRFRDNVLGKAFDLDGAYGAQCLTAGHLVAMADGSYLPVEELQEGDIVLGGNMVMSNQPQEADVVTVKTGLGAFTCTLDHKCVLEDGSVRLAKDLVPGDIIKTDVQEPEKEYDLTIDECLWLGFWLGDGTKKARWAHTTKPECFITVGTALKEQYLEKLNIRQNKYTHSNGRAKVYKLINREHPELLRCLAEMSGRALPRHFTATQYKYIIAGYIMADGTPKHSGHCITSINKELLVSIQFGAMLNGDRAILSGPCHRDSTNLCDHPADYYRLTINPNFDPIAVVKSVEAHEEPETAYVLNLNGDHLYQADNLVHHNCYDGAALLWQQLGMTLLTGNAKASGCWTQQRAHNAGTQFQLITDKSEIKRGDVVVFSMGEYGHIGFADQDYNGNNYIQLLGQNQGGTAYSTGGSAFNVVNVSLTTFLGAFRYVGWNKSTTVVEFVDATTKEEVEGPKVEYKQGDKVKVKKYVDIYGTALAKLQKTYNVKQVGPNSVPRLKDTLVLTTNDGDIYARISVANVEKA